MRIAMQFYFTIQKREADKNNGGQAQPTPELVRFSVLPITAGLNREQQGKIFFPTRHRP